MAHFAEIKNNIVVRVNVIDEDYFNANRETRYIGKWIQTSYNTYGGVHYNPETNEPSQDQSKALRKNYAGIGYTYDENRDAFIPPKPFDSWLLDEDTCWWKAPVAMPTDGKYYTWDENTTSWLEVFYTLDEDTNSSVETP
jgi:hypothetical protein